MWRPHIKTHRSPAPLNQPYLFVLVSEARNDKSTVFYPNAGAFHMRGGFLTKPSSLFVFKNAAQDPNEKASHNLPLYHCRPSSLIQFGTSIPTVNVCVASNGAEPILVHFKVTVSTQRSYCKPHKPYLLIKATMCQEIKLRVGLRNNKWDIITLNLLLLSFVSACKWKKSKNVEACSCSSLKQRQSSQQVHRGKSSRAPNETQTKTLSLHTGHWKDEDKSFVKTKPEAKVWWIQLSFKAFQKEGSTAKARYVWCHHS